MHQIKFLEPELNQLESEFEQVEKELEIVEDHPDKEKFAAIAKSIFSSMTQTSPAVSETTSRKFQQSSFLQLMDSVAKRKVELNSTSDKLIDEKGKDIREYLPDPLKDLKEGDLLESSYQGASLSQRRSGFDISPSDWEDDYRHEDDMI